MGYTPFLSWMHDSIWEVSPLIQVHAAQKSPPTRQEVFSRGAKAAGGFLRIRPVEKHLLRPHGSSAGNHCRQDGEQPAKETMAEVEARQPWLDSDTTYVMIVVLVAYMALLTIQIFYTFTGRGDLRLALTGRSFAREPTAESLKAFQRAARLPQVGGVLPWFSSSFFWGEGSL